MTKISHAIYHRSTWWRSINIEQHLHLPQLRIECLRRRMCLLHSRPVHSCTAYRVTLGFLCLHVYITICAIASNGDAYVYVDIIYDCLVPLLHRSTSRLKTRARTLRSTITRSMTSLASTRQVGFIIFYDDQEQLDLSCLAQQCLRERMCSLCSRPTHSCVAYRTTLRRLRQRVHFY